MTSGISCAAPGSRRGDGISFAASGPRMSAWKDISADVETPVSAYLKVRRPPYGFLFESVEGGERIGRYSFLGTGPVAIYEARGRSLVETRGGRKRVIPGDPFEALRRVFTAHPSVVPGRPRFEGGLVGYIGYDAVRHMERLPRPPRDDLGLPDIMMMLQETVLVFDHVRHVIRIISHANRRGGDRAAREKAASCIRGVEAMLARPAPGATGMAVGRRSKPARVFRSNISRARFLSNVRRAKRHIVAGDVIQVVLSQRLSAPYTRDPFLLYRSLRVLNPSPYMFFLECGKASLAGSSPELLVRVEGDLVEVRPIAGTRPRGRDAASDLALERELRADPKERAEHVMLVDLGRNDVGRVCRYGTVEVPESMVVERYSHVMHLVSAVRGRLRRGCDAYDVLRACFPAGTVSGAPKVRAMEIIDELEPTRRGPYAGAAGYFGYSGNLDTAIAIRSILVTGGMAHVQAGMGIVADSDPSAEYRESMAKARAGLLAVAAASESTT